MSSHAEAVRRSGAYLDRELPGSESEPRREAPSHTGSAQAPGETLRSLGQARSRRALSRFSMKERSARVYPILDPQIAPITRIQDRQPHAGEASAAVMAAGGCD